MKTRIRSFCLLAALLAVRPVEAQVNPARLPVIDMHAHTTPEGAVRWASVDSLLGIRYRLVTAMSGDLEAWQSMDTTRFLQTIPLPCDRGRSLFNDSVCYPTATDFPDTVWLRTEIQAGRIRGFAELIPQYNGISPADPRLEPYWSLAEEFDLPVGIHMGTGPPGAAYESSPVKAPGYRAAYNDPMLLEEVLIRHRRLRLIVMHAAWPLLDQLIALLYAHPGVYVDVGVLQNETLVPRAAYYRHLKGLVEAGFAKRIVFGSDFPVGQVGQGIDAILKADFLTDEQKADILCGNAMRFLRLGDSVCLP